MKSLTKTLFALLPVSLLSLFIPSPALAQTKDWSGRCLIPGTDVPTIQGLECLFYNVLQVIVYLAGLAFLFMFISGGFQYLTSANDSKKVAAASSTLTMAIVGLVGVVGSILIIRLIQNFTGVNVTNFFIPG